MSAALSPLFEMRLGLGEGPVWDEVEQAFYVVDIMARKLYRQDWRSKALREWTMPEEIGSFGLRRGGGAIVALRTTVQFLDFATGRLTPFAEMPDERAFPANRLNDGKVAPDGRFWVGSIDDRPVREPVASLYRVDPDGTCTKMFGGFAGSNGLAWSPDGSIMYHADTSGRMVHCYPYDMATGVISYADRWLLRKFDKTTGSPDGAAMDSEGFYWSAGVRGGRVNRVAPDGTIERWIDLPVRFPTMPCFGGPDLRTLFITSLDRKVPGEDPLAGTIYTTTVDVPGLPGTRFAG